MREGCFICVDKSITRAYYYYITSNPRKMQQATLVIKLLSPEFQTEDNDIFKCAVQKLVDGEYTVTIDELPDAPIGSL